MTADKRLEAQGRRPGIWVIEYRFPGDDNWTLNLDRGCFEDQVSAEGMAKNLRLSFPGTEYRAAKYVRRQP